MAKKTQKPQETPTPKARDNYQPLPTGPCQPPLFRLQKVRDDGCIGYPWLEVLAIQKSEPWAYEPDPKYRKHKSSFWDEMQYLCRIPLHDGGFDLQWFTYSDLYCELERKRKPNGEWEFEYEYRVVS